MDDTFFMACVRRCCERAGDAQRDGALANAAIASPTAVRSEVPNMRSHDQRMGQRACALARCYRPGQAATRPPARRVRAAHPRMVPRRHPTPAPSAHAGAVFHPLLCGGPAGRCACSPCRSGPAPGLCERPRAIAPRRTLVRAGSPASPRECPRTLPRAGMRGAEHSHGARGTARTHRAQGAQRARARAPARACACRALRLGDAHAARIRHPRPAS